MKTLDLSENAMGSPGLDMIPESEFCNLMSKWGKYIIQINYKRGYKKLRSPFENKLAHYISKYCSNVRDLDLTEARFFPQHIETLTKDCKQIKKLGLQCFSINNCEKELSKLFEANEKLEDITLYRLNHLCPSLLKLPKQNIKAIKLDCQKSVSNDMFSKVSIIKFFHCLVLIINISHPCRS